MTMDLMRMLGLVPFPWTTVLVWALLGLLAGMIVKVIFWGSTPGGHLLYFRFGSVGAFVGGFLGLCYHVLVGVCRLTLA